MYAEQMRPIIVLMLFMQMYLKTYESRFVSGNPGLCVQALFTLSYRSPLCLTNGQDRNSISSSSDVLILARFGVICPSTLMTLGDAAASPLLVLFGSNVLCVVLESSRLPETRTSGTSSSPSSRERLDTFNSSGMPSSKTLTVLLR